MTRLGGYSGAETRRVAESLGWEFQRWSGDHMILKRPGAIENLSIPNHSSIRYGTLRRCLRVMGLSVDEFIRMAKK